MGNHLFVTSFIQPLNNEKFNFLCKYLLLKINRKTILNYRAMSGSKMLKCILTRTTSSHVCVGIQNQSSGVRKKSVSFNKNDEYKNVQ